MKFTQLLVVLAMCSAAFAAAVSTTTTLTVGPASKPNIYYQEAPRYTVTVTAASTPVGNATVFINNVDRGNCTLVAGAAGTATCTFSDFKPSSASNLPLGPNTATATFTGDVNAFSTSSGTAAFTVYALPVVSLTLGGASNDVTIPLPSGATSLTATIATNSSGTTNAPTGTVALTQVSPNANASTITCTVGSTIPYSCDLSLPLAYLAGGQNYTLLATYIPIAGNLFGPDGSSSITVRVSTTATTTTTTTTTTNTPTTTTTNAATTTTTTGGNVVGYSSVTIATLFTGSCAVNFNATTSTSLATSLAGLVASFNLSSAVGACVDNANATFTVPIQINATSPAVIPLNFLNLTGPAVGTILGNLGLTPLSISIASGTTVVGTTTATGTTTTTTTTTNSGTTNAGTTNAGTTNAGTTNAGTTNAGTTNAGTTNAVTGASSTSSASSVVAGASVLLFFAALL